MYTSFVAVGDSYTEGLDDVAADGSIRGWADRVAEHLAGLAEPGSFRYANLAVRGRLTEQIIAEQVPVAAALGPDLASFAAGTNDVLRRRFDPPALEKLFDEGAGTLAAGGARLLLFTNTDPSRRLPLAGRLLPRVVTLNRIVASVAHRYGAVLVDLHAAPVLDDPRVWSRDRLHLNSEGHRRVSLAVLEALGLRTAADWRDPLPARADGGGPTVAAWWGARGEDLAWVGRHLGPWVYRRVAGRSSGDLRMPKRPELAPYVPSAAPQRTGPAAPSTNRDG